MARSVMRIDFLWDGSDDPTGLWVNEINPIPGSLSWCFWSHEGDSLIKLLDDLITEALDSPTRRFVTQGADGTALRSVGPSPQSWRDPHDDSRSACYGAPFTGSPAESTA